MVTENLYRESLFVPCPIGLHRGVCVDTWDLGLQPNYDKTALEEMRQFRFQVEEVNPKNGQRYIVDTKWLKKSLHPKSNMGKLLIPWKGREFTVEEQKHFDADSFIGLNALVSVGQTVRDNIVRSYVISLQPAPHKFAGIDVVPLLIEGDYKRRIIKTKTLADYPEFADRQTREPGEENDDEKTPF